jgi:quercetin dioxygenase-like cupin family protein
MEVKINEATINRPQGDRLITAPHVFINLQSYIQQLRSEEAWQKNDRNAITVFKTDGVTVVLVALHANAEISNNSVNGILTLQVLEGSVQVAVNSTIENLTEKQMLAIDKEVYHNIKADEDSFLLLTISGKA